MEQNSKWYSSKGLLPSQLPVPQRLETFYPAGFEEVSFCVVRWLLSGLHGKNYRQPLGGGCESSANSQQEPGPLGPQGNDFCQQAE